MAAVLKIKARKKRKSLKRSDIDGILGEPAGSANV